MTSALRPTSSSSATASRTTTGARAVVVALAVVLTACGDDDPAGEDALSQAVCGDGTWSEASTPSCVETLLDAAVDGDGASDLGTVTELLDCIEEILTIEEAPTCGDLSANIGASESGAQPSATYDAVSVGAVKLTLLGVDWAVVFSSQDLSDLAYPSVFFLVRLEVGEHTVREGALWPVYNAPDRSAWTSAPVVGRTGTVTLTRVEDALLEGTFEFELSEGGKIPVTDTLRVTEGSFRTSFVADLRRTRDASE